MKANTNDAYLRGDPLMLNINITQVRRQSFREFKIFRRRWERAEREDKCWRDPYKQADKQSLPSFHLSPRPL